jgi:hypothetical protein
VCGIISFTVFIVNHPVDDRTLSNAIIGLEVQEIHHSTRIAHAITQEHWLGKSHQH